MRLLRSPCLWLAALLLASSVSHAWGECYDAFLATHYDGTAMNLFFSVGHRTLGPSTCSGNAVAFDVYRSTLGHQCGPAERVTNQPIPIAWPVDPLDEFEALSTDPGVTPNTAYRYEARLVDAERNPAQGDGVNSVWGYGVVGVALLAHGQIGTGNNFSLYIDGCPDECFPSGFVTIYPSGGIRYGNTVDYYGDRVSWVHESELWQLMMWGTSIRPSTCLVAVAPAVWSTVKRLYR